MMLPLTLLALCLIATAKSQLHPTCCTQKAFSERRCCPDFEGSVCGSSSGRGSCQLNLRKDLNVSDHRCNWPHQLFDETCSCNGNYSGADCGDCKHYHHGPTCSEYVPCERPEMRELTAAQRKQLFDAICRAKTTTSTTCVAHTGGTMGDVSTYTCEAASEYDCIVAIHANSAIQVKIGDKWSHIDLIHGGPAFCPGHRCLLMRYERLLQKLSGNTSLCLPYWDWTKDGDTCKVCEPGLMGSVGLDGKILAPSCFANWKTFCGDSDLNGFCKHNPDQLKRDFLKRDPGIIKRWPSAQEVLDCVLKWPQYDSEPYDQSAQSSFRACVEGYLKPSTGTTTGSNMHNRGHVEVGGAMLYLQTAASDPIFFHHHCQVDRICAMWQKVNCKTPADYPSDGTPPCQGLNDTVYPIMPRTTMRECMRSPEEWGYRYSDSSTWVAKCNTTGQPAAPPTTTSRTTIKTTTRTTTTTTTEDNCGWLCLWGRK